MNGKNCRKDGQTTEFYYPGTKETKIPCPAMKLSTLIVKNLGGKIDEGAVAKIFSKYGPLKQVCLSRQPPWTCMVFYENEEDAKTAVENLNKSKINSRRVMVKHASEVPMRCPVKVTKVLVEGLAENANKWEIEEAFTEFGNVLQVWVARRQPGIAFVYFSDYRHAIEAIKNLDGSLINGSTVKVGLYKEKPSAASNGCSRIYICNLGEDADELEIEEILSAFGPIKYLWFNAVPGGLNAFFENGKDAVEAIRCLDWTLMNGRPVRVLAADKSGNNSRSMTTVSVQGLNDNVAKEEIEEVFRIFGPLKEVRLSVLKPVVAHISFEQELDAWEAVWCLNETMINGDSVRVKLSWKLIHNDLWSSTRVYISGLAQGTNKDDVEKIFKVFGCLKHVWVAKPPAEFSYVFFAVYKDALNAVRSLDGTLLKGKAISVKLLVEMTSKTNDTTSKAYVMGFDEAANERNIESVFKNYGRVKQVWVSRLQPGTAVVYFYDERDAKKAIGCLDGAMMNGRRIRVSSETQIPKSDKWKSTRIFVGNLGLEADWRELEEIFMAFGPLRHVWISKPPEEFAIVYFENERDASWAARCLHNTYINGHKVMIKESSDVRWKRWRTDMMMMIIRKRVSLDELDTFDEIDQIPSSRILKCCCAPRQSPNQTVLMEHKATQWLKDNEEDSLWKERESIEKIEKITHIPPKASFDLISPTVASNKFSKKSNPIKPCKKINKVKIEQFLPKRPSYKGSYIPVRSTLLAVTPIRSAKAKSLIKLQLDRLSVEIVKMWYVIAVIVINIFFIFIMVIA